MKTSRAAVFDGTAGRMEFRDFPLPQPRGEQVLVHVLGCTICGSDLHTFEGRRSTPVPTVLGHEIVGEIVEFGESAARQDFTGNHLRVGDRATWAIVASCGRCKLCQAGLPQKCLHGFKYGHEAMRPGKELSGGLADYCLLAPGTSIVRLPDELPIAVACPASCATATIAAALDSAGDVAGRRVCILGAGMLGLTACAMAKTMGAREVVCVDPVLERRVLALDFGADRVVSPEELPEAAGDQGFDAALELSGSNAAFASVRPLLRIGGTLVLVGSVFPAPPTPVELEQIVRRILTIRGVHNYAPRHLAAAVEFLADGHRRFPFAELASSWFPLEAIHQAFAMARNPRMIRVGVYTGAAAPV